MLLVVRHVFLRVTLISIVLIYFPFTNANPVKSADTLHHENNFNSSNSTLFSEGSGERDKNVSSLKENNVMLHSIFDHNITEFFTAQNHTGQDGTSLFKMPPHYDDFSSNLLTEASPPLQINEEVDPRPWKSHDEGFFSVPDTRNRLPTNVIPSYYKLNIRPILEGEGQFTSPGDVTITVQATSYTSSIGLHSRTLVIDESSIKVTNTVTGETVAVASTSQNSATYIYTINLIQLLTPGQDYIIFIKFTAPIPSSPLAGLYRSSYVDPATNERTYLATTQLERSDARRVFPCFDEPALRAVFEISIARTNDYHSLCNMDIRETTADTELPGWVWDHYNPSVVMPTYLIAIIVSKFASQAAVEDHFNGKVSKVWAAPHLMTPGAGIYGAETTAKVITYFEEYFNTTYDLPKMDSAGIPDFSAGAMENWGLVTYRENLILYYNGTTTESARRSISSVISHELAHQWFGNIVTNIWWSDIWLNEGFATYVSYLGMSRTDPEYDPLDWIITDSYQSALSYDIGVNSQPVHNDGSNPSAVIYDKGGSIIRMMEGFLTEPTLKAGLHRYLQRFAYLAAHQDDLFQALTEQAIEDGIVLGDNLTVKDIMDTWTHQTGYPIIRVNVASPGQVTFTQESYGTNPRKVNTTVLDPDELWYVPISYHTAANPDFGGPNQFPQIWIPKNVETVVKEIDTSRWIFVNTASTGYFRVLYDDTLRLLIKAQLETDHTAISPPSRSQSLDDYFKFALAVPPYSTIDRALDWTTYMAKEDKLVPWLALFNNLGTGYTYFTGNNNYTIFKEYFSDKVDGALNLLGVEQTPERKGNNVILRARLLDWACSFGLPACNNYANKLLSQWIAAPTVNPVPVDIQAVMYCAIVAHGGHDGYEFALDQFKTTETTLWRNALGCATEPTVINRILELSLDPASGITKANQVNILIRVATSPDGSPLLFEFLQTRINEIIAFHSNVAIAQVVASLSNSWSDAEDIQTVFAFVTANQAALQSQMGSFTESFNRIRRNFDWMTNYGQTMTEWFLAQRK